MDPEEQEILKRRFDFDSWPVTDRVVPEVTLPSDLVAGLDPIRIRRIDPGDGTSLSRVSWEVPDTDDAMLVLDVRECSDGQAARELLLELLANMQAPDIVRLDDAPGDIAFGREAQPRSAVAFARDNLVVWIRNGAKNAVPVDDEAARIDRWFTDD